LQISSEQLFEVYKGFVDKYPVVSIEDAFDQDDWDAWTAMNARLNIQLVGDDLLVTNPKRVQMGIDKKACNCLLLKVNQIGTVTESIQACKMSQEQNWGVMVSHRSGETEDTFIADLVVGLCTGQVSQCLIFNIAKRYNKMVFHRSRLERPVAASVWPSTTRFCALKRSSEPMLATQERASAIPAQASEAAVCSACSSTS
jgi:enolase